MTEIKVEEKITEINAIEEMIGKIEEMTDKIEEMTDKIEELSQKNTDKVI